MKNKNILTTILVIALLSIFLIKSTNNNFFKMNSKYKLQSFNLKQDPLKTKIYTLENGLKVFLTEYKNAPRLQTSIAVRAGSKHDPSDATGLAHYLEHMLFKGTNKYGTINFTEEKPLLDKIEDLYEEYRKVPMSNVSEREKIWNKIDSLSNEAAKFAIANEYDKMVSGIGAKGTNAYTSNEKTVYIDSNRLMKKNFVDKCKQIFDKSDFVVLKHPSRKSFLDELIDWYLISVIKQKDFKKIIKLFEKYNYDYNTHLCPHLYCIWRRDSTLNREFSKQWWKNYNIFKLRDQLLFSLTLQQKLYSPSIIAKDNFTNKINHFKTYQKNKKKVKNIFEIVANVRNLTSKNLSFSLDTLKWRKIERK